MEPPQYSANRLPSSSVEGGGGGGSGGGGGTLFFGNNFTLASASASATESPGGARLPRTPVEPGRRPSAALYGHDDSNGSGGGGGLVVENSAWLRWSRDRRASVARRQHRDAQDSLTALAAISESGRLLPPPLPRPVASTEPAGQQLPMKPPLQHQPMRPHQHSRGGGGSGGGSAGGKRVGRRGGPGIAEPPDLSMAEWSRLLAFWQHPTFNRARAASLLMLVMSLITGVTAVSCRGWAFHLLADNATSAVSGLWDTCFLANGTCVSAFDLPTPNSDASDWQKSVAALLVSSILLAAIGCVVALCGFWASYLPRKMYYYHSSGEMFLVSAMIASISVGVYPYSVKRFALLSVSYGYGYGLGWATVGLEYLAAFTMMLDVLVRESSRPRPWIDSIRRRICCCCSCCRQSSSSYGRSGGGGARGGGGGYARRGYQAA